MRTEHAGQSGEDICLKSLDWKQSFSFWHCLSKGLKMYSVKGEGEISLNTT